LGRTTFTQGRGRISVAYAPIEDYGIIGDLHAVGP
jgi:hypothetical protein